MQGGDGMFHSYYRETWILSRIITLSYSHRGRYHVAGHTENAHYDNPEALTDLKGNFAREHGYANLRYNWVPGYPDEMQAHPQSYKGHRAVKIILTWSRQELSMVRTLGR